MLIFSVSFQFYRVQPRRVHYTKKKKRSPEDNFVLSWGDLDAELLHMVTIFGSVSCLLTKAECTVAVFVRSPTLAQDYDRTSHQ